MSNFSTKLKFLRQNENLTQTELAEAIKFNQTTISTWEMEKAEPTASALIEISKYFNISLNELLGIESEENISKPTNTVIEHYSDAEKRLINLYRKTDATGQQVIEDTAKALARQQEKRVPIRSVARTADNSPSYEEIWVTEEEAAKLKERLHNAPKLDAKIYD